MSPRWRSAEERNRRAAVQALLPKASLLGVSEDELVHRALFFRRDAGGAFTLPGDTPDVQYVVGLGAVMTTVPLPDTERRADPKQLVVQIAKPGYVVGVGPLGREHQPVRLAVTALMPSTVVGLSRDFLIDVLRRQSAEDRLRVAGYHAHAMSRVLHTVCQLLLLPLEDRLALRLAEVYRDFPAPGQPGAINPALNLIQTTIGELTGGSRSSVNKALHRLVANGILKNILPHICFVSLPRHESDRTRLDQDPLPRQSPLVDEALRESFGAVLDHWREQMHLPAATAAALKRRGELYRYERGEQIAVADDLFATFLVKGIAQVDCVVGDGRHVAVGMTHPGNFVGAGWPGRAGSIPLFTARAQERCVVARFRREVMVEALGTLDGDQLLQLQSYRHAALSRQLYDKSRLLCLDAPDALLYQLQVFAESFPERHPRHPRGTVIRLDLTDCREVAPRVLADFIGVGSRTVAKAFTSFLRRGIVEFVNGRILLPGFFPVRPQNDSSTSGSCPRAPGHQDGPTMHL